MAINFPSSPSDGEEYTDPNSGTWVYDSGTNSWTLVAGGSTSAFNFRGGHDFRSSTPPAEPIESGDMWIHDAPTGTIDGVYTGISGQIANGQLVLWDGNSYVMISGTLPGYPDVGDGEGGTLDSRYLRVGPNAGDQIVESTDTTTFNGLIEADDGITVTNGLMLVDHPYSASTGVTVMLREGGGPQSQFSNFFANKQPSCRDIDTVIGFSASNGLNNGVVNSYGFYGALATNSDKTYNFYAAGTAPNYFRGGLKLSTDPTVSQPGYNKTDVGFTVNAAGQVFSSSNDTPLYLNTNTTGGKNLIEIREAGDIKGAIQITDTGEVAFRQGSDYRLKENVSDLPSAVEQIKGLRPVNFNYKSNPGKTTTGFIAHELSEQEPLAVFGAKDATEAIGTLADYDGTVLETEVTEPSDLTYTEDVTDSEGVTTQTVRTRTWTATGTRPAYQGVDQTKLIPLLCKALQEALERIEALEAAGNGNY